MKNTFKIIKMKSKTSNIISKCYNQIYKINKNKLYRFWKNVMNLRKTFINTNVKVKIWRINFSKSNMSVKKNSMQNVKNWINTINNILNSVKSMKKRSKIIKIKSLIYTRIMISYRLNARNWQIFLNINNKKIKKH